MATTSAQPLQTSQPGTTMQAIVRDRYGAPDVLTLQRVPRPAPRDDEVLVRVRAASLNPRDWHLMRGLPLIVRSMGYGLRQPKHRVLGSDVAGQVEAVGSQVRLFRPGDEVFADTVTGGFAEYVCVAQDFVERKPAGLTFEHAAALPLAALTALQGLRDVAGVKPGQPVLIVGASGGVGTFAVQIAKALGAVVTGVCSARNVELVRSLGADQVIDYTRQHFTDTGQQFDAIFQLAGTDSPARCRQALTSNGTLILSSGESSGRLIGPIGNILAGVALSYFVPQRLRPLTAKRSKADLQLLIELVASGKVTPVID